MIKIGIFGASGRMGQAIIDIISSKNNIELSGGTSSSDKQIPRCHKFRDELECAGNSDVIIDFSTASILQNNIEACLKKNTPMVIGTTGFSSRVNEKISRAGEEIPIIQAGNMSLGVNLLSCLVEKTASILGEEWDIEINEAHHRYKIDSPSGTAFLLGEAAAKGRNIDLKSVEKLDRTNDTTPRKKGEIGFSAIRAGSIIGDHSVLFAHKDEMITLSHRAQDRKIFAGGAVFAAEKITSMPKGRYNMIDILDI